MGNWAWRMENDGRPNVACSDLDVHSELRRLAGLALDFCVRYSAEDANRHGFDVVVVEDACRGIDVDGSMAAARESFASLGIPRLSTGEIG